MRRRHLDTWPSTSPGMALCASQACLWWLRRRDRPLEPLLSDSRDNYPNFPNCSIIVHHHCPHVAIISPRPHAFSTGSVNFDSLDALQTYDLNTWALTSMRSATCSFWPRQPHLALLGSASPMATQPLALPLEVPSPLLWAQTTTRMASQSVRTTHSWCLAQAARPWWQAQAWAARMASSASAGRCRRAWIRWWRLWRRQRSTQVWRWWAWPATEWPKRNTQGRMLLILLSQDLLLLSHLVFIHPSLSFFLSSFGTALKKWETHYVLRLLL